MNAAAEDLVVFMIRSRDSRCSECGAELGPGRMLRKEGEKGLCLDCADLGDLVFLGAGDAALTRRATRHSRLRAVVVQWSRTRKRYERQGILVEPEALALAEEECLDDAEVRERRRLREADRREELDLEYVRSFAGAVRERFPGAPAETENRIAEHACRKYSRRVGRSAAAKELAPEAIDLAVQAHVRHVETGYDDLLAGGSDRYEARAAVSGDVARVLERWRR